MDPEKTDERNGEKTAKIVRIACIILVGAVVVWYGKDALIGHLENVTHQKEINKEVEVLRSRFNSIRSVHQIDGLIEDLDRFTKRYPDGKVQKDVESVRTYLTQVKTGLPLQLVISQVLTTGGYDTMSDNDVFVVISGAVEECRTPVATDRNNPELNFPVDFTWTIDSKPFLFDVNDDDATNFDRIGTVAVPCGGITGWRRLDGTHDAGSDASLKVYVNNAPECPW